MNDESSVYQIQKLNYSHEAMVDLLIQNPQIKQSDLARTFGYTEGWISRVIRSDAFREQVAARKGELVDPMILQSLEERFEALAARSAEVLMEKLDLPNVSGDLALKALEVSGRALGYGAQKTNVNVQTNFVVAMPAKSGDSDSWIEGHSPRVLNAESRVEASGE